MAQHRATVYASTVPTADDMRPGAKARSERNGCPWHDGRTGRALQIVTFYLLAAAITGTAARMPIMPPASANATDSLMKIDRTR